MEIVLRPSWVLTTEHSASSYGQPILVNRGTQEGYGPGDILRPYPSWDYTPASVAVTRMLKTCDLDEEETNFCRKFTGGML